jgi:hypothetical protein
VRRLDTMPSNPRSAHGLKQLFAGAKFAVLCLLTMRQHVCGRTGWATVPCGKAKDHWRSGNITEYAEESFAVKLVGNSARLSGCCHCGLGRRACIWADTPDSACVLNCAQRDNVRAIYLREQERSHSAKRCFQGRAAIVSPPDRRGC